MKRYYYVEDELYAAFLKAYPELKDRGTQYYGVGFDTIRIRMPTKGCAIFNRFGNKLTWLDHNGDKEYEKRARTERREKLRDLFVEALLIFQEDTGMTQGEIAEDTSISRRKINEYINHKRIPKVSTMRSICEALNINFSELERRSHVE